MTIIKLLLRGKEVHLQKLKVFIILNKRKVMWKTYSIVTLINLMRILLLAQRILLRKEKRRHLVEILQMWNRRCTRMNCLSKILTEMNHSVAWVKREILNPAPEDKSNNDYHSIPSNWNNQFKAWYQLNLLEPAWRR